MPGSEPGVGSERFALISELILHAAEGGMLPVLHLDPMVAPAASNFSDSRIGKTLKGINLGRCGSRTFACFGVWRKSPRGNRIVSVSPRVPGARQTQRPGRNRDVTLKVNSRQV